ncbi:MAG TPA: heavy metal-responsive transcriptional regulator [Vicinamibacterales bacterium]|nr:heavy metal-responsive transcriptional regulator [Vicinamibacterales bacterium]
MAPTRTYRIGELAARTGLSADTLRYYERAGLIDAPARTSGGFRLYDEHDAARLTFIRRAQAVGFSLDDIRDLLQADVSGDVRCRQVRTLITTRLSKVDERLAELRAFRRSLIEARRRCDEALRDHGDLPRCPVVDEGPIPFRRQPAATLKRKRTG